MSNCYLTFLKNDDDYIYMYILIKNHENDVPSVPYFKKKKVALDILKRHIDITKLRIAW